ncbi:uncharacterized protein ARMOST_21335 [Armillaria ostoyae]|uniref:Uncharacterized protein n=1 Tax=Armillaria ostoyae TaxID=47428 RepID=A0A284S9U6_ARMOS|nr:uncharacterized protein ARMOST_21335 [Armillaria ostoyae]
MQYRHNPDGKLGFYFESASSLLFDHLIHLSVDSRKFDFPAILLFLPSGCPIRCARSPLFPTTPDGDPTLAHPEEKKNFSAEAGHAPCHRDLKPDVVSALLSKLVSKMTLFSLQGDQNPLTDVGFYVDRLFFWQPKGRDTHQYLHVLEETVFFGPEFDAAAYVCQSNVRWEDTRTPHYSIRDGSVPFWSSLHFSAQPAFQGFPIVWRRV